MNSPACRPSGRAWVALPADRLVLYRNARGSLRSNQSSESNKLPTRQPAQPEASRMSGKGSYNREQVPCPKSGIECSDSICESTTGTCTSGHDAGNKRARTARPTRPKRIPPSWTGRTTCRTPMSTAWRAMIRSSGRNALRGSNWTNGDGSTSWKGARPAGPTSVSGLC